MRDTEFSVKYDVECQDGDQEMKERVERGGGDVTRLTLSKSSPANWSFCQLEFDQINGDGLKYPLQLKN